MNSPDVRMIYTEYSTHRLTTERCRQRKWVMFLTTMSVYLSVGNITQLDVVHSTA